MGINMSIDDIRGKSGDPSGLTTEARFRDPYRLELQIESISHKNTNHDIKTSVLFHACTFNTFFRKVISQKIYKSIITCLYECILMKHSFHSIIYYNLVDCRASKYISLTSNSYSPFIINFFFLSCLSFNSNTKK